MSTLVSGYWGYINNNFVVQWTSYRMPYKNIVLHYDKNVFKKCQNSYDWTYMPRFLNWILAENVSGAYTNEYYFVFVCLFIWIHVGQRLLVKHSSDFSTFSSVDEPRRAR